MIDLIDPGAGWISYIESPPPHYILCQFVRRICWEGPVWAQWVGMRAEFSPEFKVANLYWRLTGIGKHQLERGIGRRR